MKGWEDHEYHVPHTEPWEPPLPAPPPPENIPDPNVPPPVEPVAETMAEMMAVEPNDLWLEAIWEELTRLRHRVSVLEALEANLKTEKISAEVPPDAEG